MRVLFHPSKSELLDLLSNYKNFSYFLLFNLFVVNRLTYWLSNTVILREIISQTFGNISSQSNRKVVKVSDSGSNGNTKWQNGTLGKQGKNLGIFLPVDDWTETYTFTTALEKIESWIFSRIVESVWWQVGNVLYLFLFQKILQIT